MELQPNGLPEQVKANQKLVEIGKELNIPLVATNDAHYTKREDAYNHEVLLCIQTGKKMSDTDRMRFETDDFYIKSPEEVKAFFPNLPEALENTVKIAEKCNFDFEFGFLPSPKFKSRDPVSLSRFISGSSRLRLRVFFFSHKFQKLIIV